MVQLTFKDRPDWQTHKQSNYAHSKVAQTTRLIVKLQRIKMPMNDYVGHVSYIGNCMLDHTRL